MTSVGHGFLAVINPVLGCRYFPAGRAKDITPLTGTKLYSLVTEAHRLSRLPKSTTRGVIRILT